jgi:hypothetical protein
MKKKNLNSLSLNKRSISNLNKVSGGAASLITIIYSYYQCDDIIKTSKDEGGKHCDIATINDSCLSVCDDMCNDF